MDWNKKINDEDFEPLLVKNLADRPNVPSTYGAGGLSAKELKERFDKSAHFLKDKINAIIEALGGVEALTNIRIKDESGKEVSAKEWIENKLLVTSLENPGSKIDISSWVESANKFMSENADKVGFTDYATSSKAGVVKVSQGSYTSIGITDGLIKVLKATEEQIAARGANYTDNVLSASKTNAIVKAALTDEKKMLLSDGEKATARETLGAASTEDVNGMHLALSMDDDFKLTVSLLNTNNEVISTTKEIDLPLEEMIVSGKVSDDGEKIILTLKNSETIEFAVSALVGGLAKQEDLDAVIEDIEALKNKGVELAPTLEGNEADKAPSVKAVNAGITASQEAVTKYVDTPSGEVDAGCTTPVSGSRIYHAIEEATDAHDKRITNLENAANDILYTYPTEEATFAHRRMTEDTLAHAALLQLGAAPQEHVNLFPEQMLFDFKNENLTITWDDEEKALVINGTLHATESPLVLFSYHLQIPDFRLSFGAFYRGGSVSTQSAKLHIVSNTYSYVDIGLLTEDVTFSKPRSVLGGRFYSIELMADEDTVFENYRFNVLVSREQSFIRYTPFDTRNHFSFPRKLVALGPNVWNGEEKLCGETYVSFTPPTLPGVYTYALGFSGISSHPETPPLLINFYTEDGFVLEKDLDPGIFHTTTYVSEKPITEIRVYAAETEEDSVGYQVQIEKIYVEPVPAKQKGTREYSPYHRDEIVFPETLSRFADDFVGDGVTYFNYFDFEDGMYYKKCNTFSIDGSLDFQVDETASGTVFAPISLLTETQEKNLAFQASGVFMKAVNTYHSERVWFENGCFYCHSKLFTGKTAEQVKRFFSLCPVDISWEKKSEKYSLTIEEKALLTAPTICLAPNAYLYFADEEGNPVNARSVMQYQVKQTMEVTE